MRQLLFIAILTVGSLVSFAGCFVALTDWVQDFKQGVYMTNHLEAILETSALFLYGYLAVRFVRNKVNL